jgi:hypothetical protein
MKHLMTLLFAVILFANCNNNKGWTADEMQKSLKLCMDGVEGKLADKEAKKFCSCLMEKATRKYPTYEAADKAITNEEGKMMGQACVKELGIGGDAGDEGLEVDPEKKRGGLFGGGGDDDIIEKRGGGWSQRDKNAFLSPCQDGLTDKGYSTAQARQLCSCALEKLEKRYSSLSEGNDKGGEAAGTKAMQECAGVGGGDYEDEN